MSKKETIRPELFEIKFEHTTHYVVAYDTIHAMETLQQLNYKEDDEPVTIKRLTGMLCNHLRIAKECLPQGLVNKTI